MDFKDLVNLSHALSGDIFLIWGVHTTVVIALIGWLLTKRKSFTFIHKLLATIGYSIVVLIVIGALHNVYDQLSMLSIDITNAVTDKMLPFAKDGYQFNMINKEGKMNYTNLCASLWRSIPIAVFFYIFMLFLIWNDWMWKKLYENESNEGD